MKNEKYLLVVGVLLWLLITYSGLFSQVTAEVSYECYSTDSLLQPVQFRKIEPDFGRIQTLRPALADGTASYKLREGIAFGKLPVKDAKPVMEGIVAARKRKYLPGIKIEPGPHGCE